MGYTNYFNQRRNFNDDEWKLLQDEVTYLNECGRIILRTDTPHEVIAFDGKGEDTCETFVLAKDLSFHWLKNDEITEKRIYDNYVKRGHYFGFCKTRMYPYDIDVWHLLTYCRVISPENFSCGRDR